MVRYEMIGFERCVIKRLLPQNFRGVLRVDDKRVLNSIFRILRSGIPWANLSSRYRLHTTYYNQFTIWHLGSDYGCNYRHL